MLYSHSSFFFNDGYVFRSDIYVNEMEYNKMNHQNIKTCILQFDLKVIEIIEPKVLEQSRC